MGRMGAPRRDREAEPPPRLGGGIEIADRDDDMVEAENVLEGIWPGLPKGRPYGTGSLAGGSAIF